MFFRKMYDESAEGGVAVAEPTTADIDASEPLDDVSIEPEPSVSTTTTESVGEPVTEVTSEPTLLSKIRETHGVDFTGKYADDDALLKGLVNAANLVGKRDQYANYGRQYAQHAQEFQQYLKSRQQPAAAVPAAEPEVQAEAEPWWNPPEWNKQNERFFTTNPDTGQVEPVENAPVEVQQEWLKHLNYHQEWSHKLQTNPVEALAPFGQEIENKILRRVEEYMSYERNSQQQQQQQAHLQADASGIVQQNEEWLYERNTDGNYVQDDRGQRIYTPSGASYVGHIARLVQGGMVNQQQINQTAIQLARAELMMQPQQPAPAGTSQTPGSPQAPAPGQPAPPKSTKGSSLRDQLLSATEGVSDEEFDQVD